MRAFAGGSFCGLPTSCSCLGLVPSVLPMMDGANRNRRWVGAARLSLGDFWCGVVECNPHVMTVLPGRWPRRALLTGVSIESRLFTTEPHTPVTWFLPLAAASHRLSDHRARAQAGGFQRASLYAWDRFESLSCRTQRYPDEPALVWRDRTPHSDAVQQRLGSGLK